MKKILLVLLMIFLLVGCGNSMEKLIDESKKIVSKELKDVEDIGKDKVKKSIKYIVKNYDKKIDKDFVYNTILLNTVTDSSRLKNNNIKKLADKAYKYILKQSKENKKELKNIIDKVEDYLDEELEDFYNIYKNSTVVNNYFSKAKSKIIKSEKVKDYINKNAIKQETNYIINNYKNYYRDTEVIESISYSIMYLDNIGTKYNVDNNIIKIARYTKKYMQENDKKYLDEIKKIIKDVKSNMDQYIDEIMKAVSK